MNCFLRKYKNTDKTFNKTQTQYISEQCAMAISLANKTCTH